MRKLLLILAIALAPHLAKASICSVNSGQSQSTIQSTINSCGTGNTVSFAAGTYSVTSAFSLPCGLTYTGPTATPATAILNGSSIRMTEGSGGDIFTLAASSCSQMTTIEYFEFENAGGIYVNNSFSNITITHNQFVNLPCCQMYVDPSTTGIYFDAGSYTPSTEILTNATVTWNTIGDSTSCLTPTDVMDNYDSPEDIEGNCGGIAIYSSVNGLTIENNVIGPVSEGIHFLCTSSQCEPSGSPAPATLDNITAEYNDFVGIHRIAWEEQPQPTANNYFEYNSEHDATNPYFGNFALSMACCDTGATAPGIIVSNNVLLQNTPPITTGSAGGHYGFGIEAWGNDAVYSYNLVQSVTMPGGAAQGIAYCYGMTGGTVSNNTVQGPSYDTASDSNGGDGYIGNEGVNNPPPCGATAPWTPSTLTGNSKSLTRSTVTSVAPTISPPSGSQTFPLTVTLTDAGYSSGPQPLGNTSIWYTTDGSTPVPGSNGTQVLTGGTFVISSCSSCTVKAVGMWGQPPQPASFPSGYGFVPSSVVSVSYTGGTPQCATPVVSPASQSFTGSLSVTITDSTSGSTIYYTTDGSTPTTGSPVYTGGFYVTTTTTVQAIATASGYTESAVGSAVYTYSTGVSDVVQSGLVRNTGGVRTQ